MEILACVKRVPDTADADLALKSDGRGIEEEDLAFGINEWDNYAVEEAIRIKESHGGKVTVLTVGSAGDEDILRRCMAMGADGAVRIDSSGLEGSDPYGIARIIHGYLKSASFDLVLTGTLAGDDGYGIVGPALAGLLGWPHVTLVTSISFEGRGVTVTRELEGGLEEVLKTKLPAVLSIQTGINEPRYVSIMGIRKVRSKEVPVMGFRDLDFEPGDVGENGNLLRLVGISQPPAGKEAEILEGSPAELAERILELVKERGGVA